MAKIKQVTIDNTTYDLDAKYFDGHDAKYWEDLIDAHMTIKGPYFSDNNPIPTQVGETYSVLYDGNTAIDPGAATSEGAIFLFNRTNVTNQYYEYVSVTDSGSQSSYWTFIGTSQTDMQNYVKKGTYTTASPSTLSTSTPSRANTEWGVYDSLSIDPNEVTTTITIPVVTRNAYNGATSKTINGELTTISDHRHIINTTEKTVVTTTPSWSATVVSEVLSFTFNAGSTSVIDLVSDFDSHAENYVTGLAGSHAHRIREYINNSWTPISASFNIVNSITTTPVYYVGIGDAPGQGLTSEISLAVTVRKHVHSMGNHTHGMNHTHDITLS